jgi:hypothetical protein
MPKYVIREIIYYYDDQFELELCEGGIDEVFDDKSVALQAFDNKETKRIKEANLYITVPIANGSGDDSIQQKLHDYFVENFNLPLITEQHGYLGIHDEFEIPQSATNQQILEIRNLTGIRFHTLTEFSNEAVFYTIRYNGELIESQGHDWQNDVEIKAPYFYNSREEAIQNIPYKNYNTVDKIEDLIETPSILEHYISTCKDVNYDVENSELSVKFSSEHKSDWEKQRSLLILLKNSPIKLEELSLQDAQNIDSRAFWSF